MSALRVQAEKYRLVQSVGARFCAPRSLAPLLDKHLYQLRYADAFTLSWAKIPRAAPLSAIYVKALGEEKIATERFENMLPRSYCAWITDDQRLIAT
jgi:hypothetical protein